jgi:hypothetical protein
VAGTLLREFLRAKNSNLDLNRKPVNLDKFFSTAKPAFGGELCGWREFSTPLNLVVGFFLKNITLIGAVRNCLRSLNYLSRRN